ncbi:unnamed protein product [Urochloa humidicola]
MGVMQSSAHACKASISIHLITFMRKDLHIYRFILLMDFLESYLVELSLVDDYVCLLFLPSVVVASVMFVGRLPVDPNVNLWAMNKKAQLMSIVLLF